MEIKELLEDIKDLLLEQRQPRMTPIRGGRGTRVKPIKIRGGITHYGR